MAKNYEDTGEPPEAVHAFERYVSMGTDRSMDKLTAELGVSRSTIANWSRKFGWTARIKQLHEEYSESHVERIKIEFFRNSENLEEFKFTILQKLKDQFEASGFCGGCKRNKLSVSDMIAILNVVKTELGEPTSIAKGTYTGDAKNPFAAVLSKMFGDDAQPKNTV